MAHKRQYEQLEFTWFGPPQWRALATRVVGAAIDRYAWRFRKFGEVDEDDLKNEALRYAFAAYEKFDPKKSKPSTFITMVALRRLLTMCRTFNCRRVKDQMQREKTGAEEVWENQDIPAIQERGDITIASRVSLVCGGKHWRPGEWIGYYVAVQIDGNATLIEVQGNSKNKLFFAEQGGVPVGVFCLVSRGQ